MISVRKDGPEQPVTVQTLAEEAEQAYLAGKITVESTRKLHAVLSRVTEGIPMDQIAKTEVEPEAAETFREMMRRLFKTA